jgi:tRNA pseudouridine55 synthase
VAINLYKQKGETPLQALERFRIEEPTYSQEKLSYAGRLDPMAEGIMLVLVGSENTEREKYLGLDKTYVTEILFGISTDTGDVLGLSISGSNSSDTGRKIDFGDSEIKNILDKSIGKFSQKYPAYSSKSFAGDYQNARSGSTAEHSHEVEIYSAELLDTGEISASNLLSDIEKDIAKVEGDFRQAEILAKWQEILTPKGVLGEFIVAKIRLKVSSGFYVRQFAEDLGKSLGVPALVLSILREQVGDYGLDSIGKK